MAKPDDLSESPDTHIGEGKIKSHRLFCDFPICLMVCACPLHSQIKLKRPQRPVFWRSPFVSGEVQSCGRARPLWISTAYLCLPKAVLGLPDTQTLVYASSWFPIAFSQIPAPPTFCYCPDEAVLRQSSKSVDPHSLHALNTT